MRKAATKLADLICYQFKLHIMKIKHHDTKETVNRLRKHPIWTMDAQNITADAADHIEDLEDRINRAIHYLVAVPFVEQGNAYELAIDILSDNTKIGQSDERK